MEKNDKRYQAYLDILKEELLPAMGCTEPISIAFAAARAREILGRLPERVLIQGSGNIIKNVKSVVVPNTGGLRGIAASAAAGIVAGDPAKMLEVISEVSPEQKEQMRRFLETCEIEVKKLESGIIFDLIVTLYSGQSEVSVRISHHHTNIVSISKDGENVFEINDCNELQTTELTDRSIMKVRDIVDFAETVEVADLRELIERQIEYNTKIAAEGIEGDWGANVGSVLLKTWGDDVKVRAKAMAAAGSDARMGGCELPVVIVSGSGNQGITASVPVIEYAKELGASREKLIRALVLSNLVTIHQKTGIGRLSAYCGAISAGIGAGAAIAWLHGGDLPQVTHTIVNALAIVSGIICDGAKPSCAGKIAAAVDAGILGFYMYRNGQQFLDGDGIIKKGIENTINIIGRLGRDGMAETDKEILRLMLGQE